MSRAMTPSLTAVQYRPATTADVPGMARCRLADPGAGVADPGMAASLDGHPHPQQALPPRVAFVALVGTAVVGYIAGHLTRRKRREVAALVGDGGGHLGRQPSG